MSSVIKEFYYGNIRPTNLNLSKDPTYMQTMAILNSNHDELMGMLNELEKEQFKRYLCVQEEASDMERYEAFRFALRFGILLMAEVFVGMGEITGVVD